MSEDNVEQTIGVLDKILQVAESMKITSAQLALAWLLAQGDDIFPIPGTSKIHRLEENLGALSVSLSDDDERKLREVSEEIVGGRFQAQARTGYDFADTPDLDHWICLHESCLNRINFNKYSGSPGWTIYQASLGQTHRSGDHHKCLPGWSIA